MALAFDDKCDRLAKGIKKISTVKKQRITDLTVSSIDAADRAAGHGCRIMLVKRDPTLTAIDRAFADHRLAVDNAFAESVIDGTGGAGFDRRAAKLRKKLDRKLRQVRQGAVRPVDPPDEKPGLSAGSDPSDVESDGAFADRDGARRFRQNASPGMAAPAGDDFALSPAPSGGMSDRLGPTARRRYDRMQKAASAQKRDGETEAMALSRWITDTREGKAAYAEDRHAALTEACKVYRGGAAVADPTPAEDQCDDHDGARRILAPARPT